LITGPNPIANNVSQFLYRCWPPILVRGFADSIAFWILFTPGVTDRALNALGWQNSAWVVMMITQFAPVAASYGYMIDSIMDIALSKLPYVKDAVPQMPGPLPASPNPPTGD